jgi:hypothetical protein
MSIHTYLSIWHVYIHLPTHLTHLYTHTQPLKCPYTLTHTFDISIAAYTGIWHTHTCLPTHLTHPYTLTHPFNTFLQPSPPICHVLHMDSTTYLTCPSKVLWLATAIHTVTPTWFIHTCSTTYVTYSDILHLWLDISVHTSHTWGVHSYSPYGHTWVHCDLDFPIHLACLFTLPGLCDMARCTAWPIGHVHCSQMIPRQ